MAKFSTLLRIHKNFRKKYLTIGVDVGREYLRLAKIARTSHNNIKLLACKSVSIPQQIPRETHEFVNFLKSELVQFCGKEKFKLWAIMSAAQVQICNIRIPKVAKSQIGNAVYWTVKKESPFDEKETFLDFEVLGEIIDHGIPKLSVTAYTAPIHTVEKAKKLFSDTGLPLAGMTIIPFTIQNILRAKLIPSLYGTVTMLFIGDDFSRIEIFSKGTLVMNRDIKAGVSSMVELLVDALNAKKPTEDETKKGAVLHDKASKEEARNVILNLTSDSPSFGEKVVAFGLKEKDIFEMIQPAIDRLIKQIERTFEYYTINLENEKIDKICISSLINMYMPLMRYISNSLDVELDMLDPMNSQIQGQGNDLKSVSLQERIAFATAVGLAISDNAYTPNLIYTYKDKISDMRFTRIKLGIFASFVVAISICSLIFLSQFYTASQKKNSVSAIEQQLLQYNPPLARNMILQMATDAKHLPPSKLHCKKYLGIAVISELSAITPPNIKLFNVKIDLGGVPSSVAREEAGGDVVKSAQKKGDDKYDAVIDGIAMGERNMLEANMFNYAMKLRSSVLFSQVVVQKSKIEPFKMDVVLHFTINFKISGKNS